MKLVCNCVRERERESERERERELSSIQQKSKTQSSSTTQHPRIKIEGKPAAVEWGAERKTLSKVREKFMAHP